MEEMNIFLSVLAFFIGLIFISLPIIITFLVFRWKSEYIARKCAEAFEYEYLAEKIAEEICKRMLLIEKHKEKSNNEPTQSDDTTTTPNPS